MELLLNEQAVEQVDECVNYQSQNEDLIADS